MQLLFIDWSKLTDRTLWGSFFCKNFTNYIKTLAFSTTKIHLIKSCYLYYKLYVKAVSLAVTWN